MYLSMHYLRFVMSLFVSSLNSGSNGNCYYIASQEEAVLIDAGISCRETEKRMKRLGLSMKKVKAVFITHEHADHIHGAAVLSKKFKLPVYITPKTLTGGRIKLDESLMRSFKPNEAIRIGGISVTAFSKIHDAADPHSFIVSSESVNVGVFTDIGILCENVITHFEKCHAAFLESNYDEEMLEKGSYPVALKNRIRDGKGHLSNMQALRLFLNHKPAFMTHLFLSHLSQNNNSPKIVKELFSKIGGHTEIIVASRKKETALYHIRSLQASSLRTYVQAQELQLSLF